MPKRGANVFYSSAKRTRYVAAKRTRPRPAITRAPATSRVRTPRAELKDHEGVLAVASPINLTGVISPTATAVPLGDNAHSRDGRVIFAKTLNWRLYLESAVNTTGDNCGAVRVIIFRWDDDSVPVPADIITSASVTAVYNLNNVFKMKVLEDRLIAINSFYEIGGDAVPSCAAHTGSIPLGFQMGYDDSNGTQEKGAIYVLYNANVNNWFNLSMRSQLLYYDV